MGLASPVYVYEESASVCDDDLSTYSDEWGKLWVVPGQRLLVHGAQPSVTFAAGAGLTLAAGAVDSDSDDVSEDASIDQLAWAGPVPPLLPDVRPDECVGGPRVALVSSMPGSEEAPDDPWWSIDCEAEFGEPEDPLMVDEFLYGDSMAEASVAHYHLSGADWMGNVMAFMLYERWSFDDVISTTVGDEDGSGDEFGSEPADTNGVRSLGGSD